MFLNQKVNRIEPVKILINIGCLMDVPTGFIVEGRRGESVLLGGLGSLTSMVGRGNRFKTTMLVYMMLSAMNRIFSTVETSSSTYDTEINIHETAFNRFTKAFKYLKDRDILNSGIWAITDKIKYSGNKFFENSKEFINYKLENKKETLVDTPFLDRDKVSPLKVIVPTFTCIDSFTEFSTDDVLKMQDDTEIGDSQGNTIHMRLGLAKTRFMMEAPSLYGSANHFLLLTAHLGDMTNIAAGPYAPPPVKKLQHMKANDKVKGVSDKFFFLMNNGWQATSATPLNNQGTKGPEYPVNTEDDNPNDLFLVTLLQLRGKAGPSGFNLNIVLSQSEGVLPSLTEFHYLKESDRFGLSGTLQSYSLDIYPDVKLSRTTVRSKINSDPKLQRALNITAELCQFHEYYRSMKHILCTPKELYDGLIAKGYNWDVILEKTRGWWAFNDDKHELKFLSTMDLINMKLGLYEPYWLKDLPEIKNKT